MRRTVGRCMAVAALLVSVTAGAAESDLEARTGASRLVIKSYAKTLKAELTGAIEASGPVGAIEVCSEKAPAIAREHADKEGWLVGRTSLRYRNPDNAPDPWERAILQSFEDRKAAGEDPAAIDHAAFVVEDGRLVFRYMKAIPTGGLCLNCHGGAEVSPEVAEELAELYPDDRARGFRVGDIRGAFTVVQPAE